MVHLLTLGEAAEKAAAALAKLEGLGLVERIKRPVRLSWHQGGQASRQATSCYRLNAPAANVEGRAHTESSQRTVNRGMEISYKERTPDDDAEAARKALAVVRERRRPLVDALLGRRATVR